MIFGRSPARIRWCLADAGGGKPGVQTIMKSVCMLVAVAATLVAPVPAAATFTLGNSQGGDGFVIEIAPGRFDLFGANDETEGNLTSYTTTALTAGTISGQFRYLTLDIDGSTFDPAGYFINNVFVALSEPDLLAYSQNFDTLVSTWLRVTPMASMSRPSFPFSVVMR